MEITYTPALSFDDVLLKPGHAGFPRSEVSTQAKLTADITLDVPFVSAPMDTVTEYELAIALARAGGIGIIHRNLTPDAQAAEVEKVKAESLRVGAAVGSKPGYLERVEHLVDAGVDVIVVDSAHGFVDFVLDAVRTIKANYNVPVIGGSVATAEGARALIDVGADALRVGMGPGAICTTRIVSGMGVPQFTALVDACQVAVGKGIPVIADGGINYPGDVTKALAAGASTVMMGRLFAATRESCGAIIELPASKVPDRFKSILHDGQEVYEFKAYRGMGSVGAMATGKAVQSEDEFHGKSYTTDVLVPEGVEGLVPCNGPVEMLVEQYKGGLVAGMYYTGASTIQELHAKAHFQVITQASLKESHPHDLFVTNDGGLYHDQSSL